MLRKIKRLTPFIGARHRAVQRIVSLVVELFDEMKCPYPTCPKNSVTWRGGREGTRSRRDRKNLGR